MSGEPGDLQRTFGRNLRAWRRAQGLSQAACAEVVGIDRTYLSGVERGQRNPSLRMVERMAQRLGVPVSDLLTE